MAKDNGNGRKPFKKDENVQAWKLLAKSAVRIDDLAADMKQERERFEKLKQAVKNGGYLVEGQGHLPLEEEHEEDPDGARA